MIKTDIKFQSYSWSYGTTSFRVSELKYKIERQLIRLKELWQKYPQSSWREIQDIYFEILVEEGLSQPTSNDRAKDARQKTSSLKDLGLITDDRKLTKVGEKLYTINKIKKFQSNNIFSIKDDNFIYFIQLFKMEFSKYSNSRSYSEFQINPFLSIIYAIIKLGFITKDEFTYLLPLAKNNEELKVIVFELSRDRKSSPFKIIKNHIKQMQNYQDALKYFLQNEHTLETFEIITMDRKSKKGASPYLELFKLLHSYFLEKQNYNYAKKEIFVKKLLDTILQLPAKNRVKYYKLLLNSSTKPTKNFDITYFEEKTLINSGDENLFFEEFFYLIHSIKWHTNLEEYYDLNKRFLSLSDVFIFEDENIYLDEIVFASFEENIESLLDETLSNSKEDYSDKLVMDTITDNFGVDEEKLFERLKAKFSQLQLESNLKEAISNLKETQKIARFNELIEKRFSDENLTKLLKKINIRDDSYVKNYLDWECDLSTIFEYLIGICWYKISKHTGNLSKFLNMSLDANLLPVRFASGGKADIVFEYDGHDVMIEVTLSNKDSQRKMELEPVSRHLGRYRLENQNKKHYAIFIAPHLDPNVLVGFRSYSKMRYYNVNDTNSYIKNLKIIPLNIDDVIDILNYKMSYEEFYKLSEEVYLSDEDDGYIWYEDVLQKRLLEFYGR